MDQKSSNIDKELDKLKLIKTVDTPPYLFTRIKHQIDSIESESESETAPAEWKWGFALTMIIVLALNISTLFNSNTSGSADQTSGINEVVSYMNMSSNNELYKNND
ncbi:MAG: hypothetical protein KDD00_17035 [Ignavibacteriae bacterium]|nr:hypothetical protein [Ignavibacteriota bacterium]